MEPNPPLQPSRPRVLDHFLILFGAALSVFLARACGLRIVPSGEQASGPLGQAFQASLPAWLFLPVGITLFWPLFYLIQRSLGRPGGLAPAEWLWGLSWLISLFLAIWMVWSGSGTAPSWLGGDSARNNILLVYILIVLSLAVVALVLFIMGFLGAKQRPWTHGFALILQFWPVVPLAIIWLGKYRLR